MARKNLEGNFKTKARTPLTVDKRTNRRSEQRSSLKDREDLEDEDLDLESDIDAEYELEEEEDLEEDLEEENEDAEEEERLAGSSLTRRRHHDREQVSRVGRVKTSHRGFSSNGQKANKEVKLRERSNGSRTERRKEVTVPVRETRNETSSVSRINRVRATSKAGASVPVSANRKTQPAKTTSPRSISGNGKTTSARFTDRTTRAGKSRTTTPTSRRRER